MNPAIACIEDALRSLIDEAREARAAREGNGARRRSFRSPVPRLWTRFCIPGPTEFKRSR